MFQGKHSPIARAGFGVIEHKNAGGDEQPSILQVKQLIESIGSGFAEFKQRHDDRFKVMQDAVDGLLLKSNRPGLGASFSPHSGSNEEKALSAAVRALVAGDQQKADALFIEAKAMSVGSESDGGYVVHPTLSTGMTKVMAEISPFYRLARVIPLRKSDSFEEIIDRDSADAEWVSEAGARNDTGTPELGKFLAPLHEIFAMPKVTQKLIDTADIDVMAWLAAKVGEAFAVKEGTAFHTGTGVGRPRGILAYPATTAADAARPWGTFQYIPSGVSGAFSANRPNELVDMITALKPQYRAGAVWLMNRNTAGAVQKLKDADGRFLWNASLIAGQPSTLLGYPVEIDEDMPDIAADSFSIAFGNIARTYTVIEMPGAKFLTDPYTSKPHVRLYAYRRVGGGANNTEALKLMKFAAT